MRRSVTVGALLWAGLVAVWAGCGRAPARQHRSDDAGPAVVYVDQGDGQTSVPPPTESEPNDAPDQAQPLALPGSGGGVIGAPGDKDSYAIDVKAPGYLSVRLSGGQGADLVLDLADDHGKVLATSDNGPSGTVEGLPNYAVDGGRYILVVREFVKRKSKPRTEPSGAYQLEVAMLGPPGALPDAGPDEPQGIVEAEPNDDPAFAADLPLGGAGRGWLGWRKDRDVWKVPLATAGDDAALSVDVTAIPGVELRVGVLDGTGTVLQERKGKAGQPVALRNVAVREGEPHYYVSIAPVARADAALQYSVSVAATAFMLDEEEEPNDALKTAGPLSDVPDADAGTRVGFLPRGDVDVFRVESAAAPRRLTVAVEPPGGVDAELSILGPDGKPIAGPANAKKGGGAERLADVDVPAGAVTYVRVTGKGAGSDSERYRLRWSAVTGAPETAPVPGIDDE